MPVLTWSGRVADVSGPGAVVVLDPHADLCGHPAPVDQRLTLGPLGGLVDDVMRHGWSMPETTDRLRLRARALGLRQTGSAAMSRTVEIRLSRLIVVGLALLALGLAVGWKFLPLGDEEARLVKEDGNLQIQHGDRIGFFERFGGDVDGGGAYFIVEDLYWENGSKSGYGAPPCLDSNGSANVHAGVVYVDHPGSQDQICPGPVPVTAPPRNASGDWNLGDAGRGYRVAGGLSQECGERARARPTSRCERSGGAGIGCALVTPGKGVGEVFGCLIRLA